MSKKEGAAAPYPSPNISVAEKILSFAKNLLQLARELTSCSGLGSLGQLI